MRQIIAKAFAMAAIATLGATAHATTLQLPAVTITTIMTYETYAVIRYSPNGPANDCTGAAAPNSIAIDWSSDPAMKVMFASVLTAYTTGKTIGFGATIGTQCFAYPNNGTIPLVYRVDIS